MLTVRLAEYAGFCSGVKAAVEAALRESSLSDKVWTLGPLVHNEAVADYLGRHNICAVDKLEEATEGTLLIRTHGVAPAVLEEAQRSKRLKVLNLTCPKVRRVQILAKKVGESGAHLVIYGDFRHPEVKGVIGWAGEGAEVDVVASVEQLKQLVIKPSAVLIAQTTGHSATYQEIKDQFSQLCPGGKVYDTLCPETGRRQAAAATLAEKVESMVVVGSRSSANTGALVEACRRLKPTLWVTGAGELDPDFLMRYRSIGVAAGASTPHWMIKEVVERMENEKLDQDLNKEEAGSGEAEKGAEEAAGPEETMPEEVVSGTSPEEKILEEESASDEAPAESPVSEEDAAEDTPEETATGEPASVEDMSPESVDETTEQIASEEEAEAGTDESADDSAGEAEGEEAAGAVEKQEDDDEEEEEEEEVFDFAEALDLVQVGEQIVGKVVRAAEDEVYLDISYKTEALLPAKEVHLQEGETLADRFEMGQEIEVTIIDIEDRDSKVVVSHKRLSRHARWQELARALEDKTTEEGRVKQVVNAGMVLDLGEGIDGFMPGSLVDLRYIPDFKPFHGEVLQFKVIELNREKDKVILSRKKVIEDENLRKKEETLESLEVGSTIPGIVRRLTDFGAFVDVGGVDGLVHISEIAWERVEHPRDALKVGQEIEVKVLDVIPEKERISLSLRRTQPDPWTKAMQELTDGEIVSGKITRLVNFGAFVELRPGVEGLVHISQIADYHVKHPSDVLEEGETIDVKILELKPAKKRISLSIKEAGAVDYQKADGGEEDDSAGSGTVTIGDVFGDLLGNAETRDDPADEESEEEEDSKE